jgi:hypothetical protein
MPEHRITVHPSRPLTVEAADLVIEVYSDDEKLGELRISRGSIDWRSRKAKFPLQLRWEEFDALMRQRRDKA